MFRRITRHTFTGTVATMAAATLLLTGCGGDSGADSGDGGGEKTLRFTWWGNADRADRYKEEIALVEEKNPNITINGTFTDYPSYWQKRQTQSAGGGLPDVMQFDYTYLRQYGDNGLLLDLSQYFGDGIKTDAIEDSLLSTGKLDGGTYAIPTGYSAWAMFENPALLKKTGNQGFQGGSWEDYEQYMTEVSKDSGPKIYGGTDYTTRIQNLELQLRQDGRELFTDEGELNFTQQELAEFWSSGSDVRKSGGVVPRKKIEEIAPVSAFGANLSTSELSWSNFLGGYLDDTGVDELNMVAPPTDDPSADDLYHKVGLMQAASASTEHPDAAAKFVDFLINSPKVGKIFGTTLGIPASKTQLDGVELEGPDQKVLDYMDSIADRIGPGPAAPVAGYGSLEQEFLTLGKSVDLGAISPKEAAQRFFDEAKIILEQ